MATRPKQTAIILPSLRGSFGSWIYYACLMPIHEIRRRVNYADEVHQRSKPLSDMIQRSLEGPRAEKIAEYLTSNKERFFSSLVLAVYGGSPDWLEIGNFRSNIGKDLVSQISETAKDSVGFLRLSGSERIFAIDGQHRVAGIKRALVEGSDLEDDVVPVLLVGHSNKPDGMERTRRLFTTLNKRAVPVQKKDIIALDEDDVMAITCRRLVEEHPHFVDPRIAITVANQIPYTNRNSLTTIGNLYDVLKQVFLHHTGLRADSLRYNRPPDDRLDEYYQLAVEFFDALAKASPELKTYFSATTAEVPLNRRSTNGGHLLFRPIGLDIATRVSIQISKEEKLDIRAAVKQLARLPMMLDREPFEGVIWDSTRQVMITRGKTLASRLCAYMLGSTAWTEDDLRVALRHARGLPSTAKISLPSRV